MSLEAGLPRRPAFRREGRRPPATAGGAGSPAGAAEDAEGAGPLVARFGGRAGPLGAVSSALRRLRRFRIAPLRSLRGVAGPHRAGLLPPVRRAGPPATRGATLLALHGTRIGLRRSAKRLPARRGGQADGGGVQGGRPAGVGAADGETRRACLSRIGGDREAEAADRARSGRNPWWSRGCPRIRRLSASGATTRRSSWLACRRTLRR